MTSSAPPTARAPSRNHGLRNYLAHIVDGGLYMGGLAFVAPESVLPRIVESLGGPGWIIAMVPVAIPVGFVLPGLLVAHRVEQLERTLPLVLGVGVVQRLPFLVTGLTLLLAGDSLPGFVLAMVVVAPLVSGLAGGLTSPAWMELVAKTLPPNRRASAMAIRMTLAAVIGMASGGIIATVLHRWPGLPGFGMLHLITFACMILSLTVLSLVREEAVHPGHHGPVLGLRDNVKAVPGILRGSPGLPQFLMARALSCAFYIPLPFMAIHALESTGKPDSYLGILVSAQMAGSIMGNLVAGVIGDRSGARLPALLGIGLLLLLCCAVPVGTSWAFFVACFALLGLGMAALRVGMITLGLELVPVAKRATAVASIGWVMGLGLLSGSVLSGVLWTTTHRLSVLGAVSATLMLTALVMLIQVHEPRHAATAPT